MISLVVATVGRYDELLRLFSSVCESSFKDLEVILVDQNNSIDLSSIVEEYKKFVAIKHIRTENIGVSRARNIGLSMCVGEIVAFPDDDCWYDIDTLQNAKKYIEKYQCDGVFGMVLDEDGKMSVGVSPRQFSIVNKSNTWSTTIEACSFIRRHALLEVGGFDVNLGPGKNNRYGAHEIDDLVIKLLDLEKKLVYHPAIIVRHRMVIKTLGPSEYTRAYKYGLGMGYVLRKHKFSPTKILVFVAKPLLASKIFRLVGAVEKADFYEILWRSRLLGWQEYGK